LEASCVKPIAYGDTFATADRVLRSIEAALGVGVSRLRLGTADPAQVASALDEAAAAVRAVTGERPELAGAAAIAMTELAAARLDLMNWEVLRGRQTALSLAQILRRCRTAATVEELAEVIPPQTAELGYDRVLLSWVKDGRWIPRSACTRTDPAQAAAIVAAGQAAPYRRVRDLMEDQVVRMRSTILVRDARDNPRVHADLLAVTGSHSYVAAPLILRGRVVGLIHVDRNAETGTMDDVDRELLALLAEGLGLALERAQTCTEAEAVRDAVEGHARAVQDLVARLGQAQEPAVTAPSPPYGPACGQAALKGRVHVLPVPRIPDDSWRDGLTRREEQVLRLVAEGLTNSQIAERLFVAEGTVKSHVKSLMRKLGAATRAEAGAAYHRQLRRPLIQRGYRD
jgi:DNA-binding NarL/FixJ family response regulator